MQFTYEKYRQMMKKLDLFLVTYGFTCLCEMSGTYLNREISLAQQIGFSFPIGQGIGNIYCFVINLSVTLSRKAKFAYENEVI